MRAIDRLAEIEDEINALDEEPEGEEYALYELQEEAAFLETLEDSEEVVTLSDTLFALFDAGVGLK